MEEINKLFDSMLCSIDKAVELLKKTSEKI